MPFATTAMSDKSSWDAFRKWSFSIMMLFDTLAFVLFYLHLVLILWYPWLPNSLLCRHSGLSSQRNKKSTLFLWGRGGNVTKMLKNQFYYQVSQHFCRPLWFQTHVSINSVWQNKQDTSTDWNGHVSCLWLMDFDFIFVNLCTSFSQHPLVVVEIMIDRCAKY